MLFVYSGEVPTLDAGLRRCLAGRREVLVLPYSLDDLDSASDTASYLRAASIPACCVSARRYERAASLRAAVLRAGAVYLPGGNTYEFLAYARRVGLFDILGALEAGGGFIAAESAGSILLSPDIGTAAVPSRNRDVNTPRLTRIAAMGRIPFHVSPHFEPQSRHALDDLEELQNLADRTRRTVVVLEDGQGFVMRGARVVRRVGQVRTLRPATHGFDGFSLPGRQPIAVSARTRSVRPYLP